jgi:hypothetical protein
VNDGSAARGFVVLPLAMLKPSAGGVIAGAKAFQQSSGRFVYRLACRVQNCLVIAVVKDAHKCTSKEVSKHFGSVSLLR